MGDTSSDEVQQVAKPVPTSDNDSEPLSLKSRLCARKPQRYKTRRPIREASHNITYDNRYSDMDLPPTPQYPKRISTHSGPSEECIAARGKRSILPGRSHPIPVKKQ